MSQFSDFLAKSATGPALAVIHSRIRQLPLLERMPVKLFEGAIDRFGPEVLKEGVEECVTALCKMSFGEICHKLESHAQEHGVSMDSSFHRIPIHYPGEPQP